MIHTPTRPPPSQKLVFNHSCYCSAVFKYVPQTTTTALFFYPSHLQLLSYYCIPFSFIFFYFYLSPALLLSIFYFLSSVLLIPLYIYDDSVFAVSFYALSFYLFYIHCSSICTFYHLLLIPFFILFLPILFPALLYLSALLISCCYPSFLIHLLYISFFSLPSPRRLVRGLCVRFVISRCQQRGL